LTFVTNGILRNEAHNGELEKYAQVFIDEAHEFDSNTAYVLVKCLRHIDTAKYAFHLTVMSATISKNEFFAYFQKNNKTRGAAAFCTLRVPDSILLLSTSSTPMQLLKTDGRLPHEPFSWRVKNSPQGWSRKWDFGVCAQTRRRGCPSGPP